MSNLRKDVEKALQDDSQNRNSDLALILSVWEQQGLILTEAQRDFILHNAHTPESITRLRRKLQSEGQYLATETVRKGRREKQYQYFTAATKDYSAGEQIGWI